MVGPVLRVPPYSKYLHSFPNLFVLLSLLPYNFQHGLSKTQVNQSHICLRSSFDLLIYSIHVPWRTGFDKFFCVHSAYKSWHALHSNHMVFLAFSKMEIFFHTPPSICICSDFFQSCFSISFSSSKKSKIPQILIKVSFITFPLTPRDNSSLMQDLFQYNSWILLYVYSYFAVCLCFQILFLPIDSSVPPYTLCKENKDTQ